MAERGIASRAAPEELDRPLLRQMLDLPAARHVPADWKWDPEKIRSMERDVFGDDFWFTPVPGEQEYDEFLPLNPHWPVVPPPVVVGVARTLSSNPKAERPRPKKPSPINPFNPQSVGILTDMEAMVASKQRLFQEEYEKQLRQQAMAALAVPPVLIGPPPVATCRSCGKAMRFHAGYCDECVRPST